MHVGLFHMSCISGRERTIRNVTPSLTLQDKAISTLTKGYLLETHQSALSRKKSCSKYVRTSSRAYAGDAVPSDARVALSTSNGSCCFHSLSHEQVFVM